ncbi:MAG: response regulator transcription factor [Candidatus Hadarchaeota archaeon]
MKVLLVDDDPHILELGKTFMEREDDRLAVSTASSGEEALKMVGEEDLIPLFLIIKCLKWMV